MTKTRAPKKAAARTLESEHQSQLHDIQDVASARKQQVLRIQELRARLKDLVQVPGSWAEITTVKDEIVGLRSNLRCGDEIDYFAATAPILFKYYGSFEGGQEQPRRPTRDRSITTFFTHVEETGAENHTRGAMLDKYMQCTQQKHHSKPAAEHACPHCGSADMQAIANVSMMMCDGCGMVQRMMSELERPCYREVSCEVTNYAYRRANHFAEHLAQLQGKEYTEIPDIIIDTILVELHKLKVTNMATLKVKTIRNILKEMKVLGPNNSTLELHKYYEHVPYIMYKLTGVPPPCFGEELDTKLKHMFFTIQIPYLRHAPPNRKNFMSYPYVLHKFMQLLGRTEFVNMFPMLKSRDKLHIHEEVWRKICVDLNWRFMKSI
jgi:hypothetical protein